MSGLSQMQRRILGNVDDAGIRPGKTLLGQEHVNADQTIKGPGQFGLFGPDQTCQKTQNLLLLGPFLLLEFLQVVIQID